MSGTGDGPSDLLRERANQSRLKLWFLLEADRWLVTAILVTIVFGTLVGVGYLYPAAEAAVQAGDPVETVFQGLLTATITGVTLVLTLNQLVLSQELGAVEDQRERMEAARQFREDVAEAIHAPVSPARPAQFLRALVEVSGESAEKLRDSASNTADDELNTDIEEFTGSLIENADRVSEELDDSRFGGFGVISSALNFNYSWKIFAGQRIHERYRDSLDESGLEALERLLDVLQLFGSAREHFKTLYFRWDLINLSQRILGASIPALLVSGSMVLFFDEASYEVAIFGVETVMIVIAAAVTVSVLPFLILLAYVVRIATVTKHTLSTGSFILRETDNVTEVEWDR